MNKFLLEKQYEAEPVDIDSGVKPKIVSKPYYRSMLRPIYRKFRSIPYLFSKQKTRDPEFLIIGCQKSGTSSLHHYLSLHPDVWCPDKKEIHFFDYDYDLGLPYYRQFFPLNEHNSRVKLVGEATPEYIFHPYSAERIKKTNPNVKAIVLLRNPIERAFSAWRMGIRQGWETLSFEEAISVEMIRVRGDLEKMRKDPNYYGYEWNHHSYLIRGLYLDQIKHWLNFFDRGQLLVLSAEKFYSDTKQEFKKTCEFLELEEWYPREFRNMFVGISSELNPETRKLLSDYFKPHNEALFEFLGEEYDWK